MPEAPWNRQCAFQDFSPQDYLQENAEQSNENAANTAKLPEDIGNKMFLHKYQDFRADKNQ